MTTRPRSAAATALLAALLACAGGGVDVAQTGLVPEGALHADDLLVVDCLLPGQVRKLGRSNVFMTPRRPVKTSAQDCEIRGGEYVAYDRADYRTALRVWEAQAKSGDARAQTYVGGIYERGLGTEPDYAKAAEWYRRAAEQGYARAQIALGALYEQGRGVPADPAAALEWYRRASGLPEDLPYATTLAGADDPERAGGLPARLAAPSIQLIEPPATLTRGIAVSAAAPGSARETERPIVGRIEAPGGLAGAWLDDRALELDADGLFRTRVRVPAAGREVRVLARDRAGRESERRFRLEPGGGWSPLGGGAPAASRRPAATDFGRYHALVIGNQGYRHLPPLETAHADAREMARVLSERYAFRVTLLLDATRYDVLSALNRLRAELTEDDNLIVYYAGHGELDEANQRGHWLPVDAERQSTANWISNVAITDVLNAMSARHVMVISDSCYSGSLTRAALARLDAGMSERARATWVRTMAAKRSRTAFTSGGLAPVLDRGGGRHSVFARALLEVLVQNGEVLEGQRLHGEVAARVTYAAERVRFEQVPQYAPIRHAGHESGEFFLVPRGA